MGLSFALCSFKPLQGLVVADCEDQVLLDNDEDLDDTDPMNEVLLELQAENNVSLLSPILKSLENVE